MLTKWWEWGYIPRDVFFPYGGAADASQDKTEDHAVKHVVNLQAGAPDIVPGDGAGNGRGIRYQP
jgi:hypothetical protein